MLEVLVHLQDPRHLESYRLFRVTLPTEAVQQLNHDDLPARWREDPAPAETAMIGDQWLKNADKLALAVPSTIAVRDTNYLINPAHESFMAMVSAAEALAITIDSRLAGR